MGRLKIAFPYLLFGGIIAVVTVSNISFDSGAPETVVGGEAICEPCGMSMDPATAVEAEIDGETRYFCGAMCQKRAEKEASEGAVAGEADGERLIDVVCKMEVNAAWGIRADYAGATYSFCTQNCRERFVDDPKAFLVTRCVVCETPLDGRQSFEATYLDRPYSLCSEEHRAQFKADPAAFFLHTMWGIPSWLYYASIALVLVLSFGLFDLLGRRADSGGEPVETRTKKTGAERSGLRLSTAAPAVSPGLLGLHVISGPVTLTQNQSAKCASARYDLLHIGWIRAALRSRLFRFMCQAIVTGLFLLTLAAGWFGNQNPALNIAPLLTWTIWWALLIIVIMFAGKAWCYVCPWDAIAGWTERLALWKKKEMGLSLGMKWPRIIRNIALATILFVGLTWVELGFGVTMKPRVKASLGAAMVLMAIGSALLFDRKSFCRYGCLVGRVSGLYALFAGMEIRSRDDGVCKSCRTKECVKGSETAYGCPTFLYPGGMQTNTYCIQCMECIQACPHDNLAVNLRPWGSDLAQEGKPRADEAYLALLMLAITGFHGLTMTPAWNQLIDALRGTMQVGRLIGFSTGMALLMLGPIGVYAVLVAASMRLGRRDALRPLSYRDYFIRYAYALLPIALFYHVAHNLEHLLMEGPKIVALASDPFGWGWNLLGTAHWVIPPLISLEMLWLVQVVLVLVGHVYSLWVAQRTSLRLFGSAGAAFRSQLPMLAGMICFSVFSLWLLKQPMEMRTSAM